MEVRIHARRQHWWEMWCSRDAEMDAGCLRSLKTRVRRLAQEEAQTLPPINFEGAVRKFAKIGKKACGQTSGQPTCFEASLPMPCEC